MNIRRRKRSHFLYPLVPIALAVVEFQHIVDRGQGNYDYLTRDQGEALAPTSSQRRRYKPAWETR